MGNAVGLVIVWVGVPVLACYFVGKRRGRRGWPWGLLSYVGIVVLFRLPDLSKSPDERAAEKTEREAGKADRVHAKAIAKAESALAKAEGRKVLGKYGGVVLFEDGLVTPSGSCALSPDIKATVQDAGSLQKYVTSRVTLTRALTIGVFAIGAKKKKTHAVDTRELYLLVETPEFESLITCSPDHGPRVRQLATAINNAGKQRESLDAQRTTRITEARRALESLRAAAPSREADGVPIGEQP